MQVLKEAPGFTEVRGRPEESPPARPKPVHMGGAHFLGLGQQPDRLDSVLSWGSRDMGFIHRYHPGPGAPLTAANDHHQSLATLLGTPSPGPHRPPSVSDESLTWNWWEDALVVTPELHMQ